MMDSEDLSFERSYGRCKQAVEEHPWSTTFCANEVPARDDEQVFLPSLGVVAQSHPLLVNGKKHSYFDDQ